MITINFSDPMYQVDPYPTLALLREQDPIHRSPFGIWILTRHKDVVALHKDRRLGHDYTRWLDYPVFRPFWANSILEKTAESWMLFKDPPDHTYMRRIAACAFTPKSAADIHDRIITAADELIAALVERNELEFIEDFAGPFPIHVLASIMGLPTKDCVQLRIWSHALSAVFEPGALKHAARCRANGAASELRLYFREQLAFRKRVRSNNLIQWLIDAQQNSERLEESDMIGLLILLLVAGHETATNLLGNGLFALLQHPGEVYRLTNTAELWSTAVEELLRYDAPVAIDSLVALEDVEVDGTRIEAGELVLLMLAGANRDPAVFVSPDTVDVGRHPNPHLAFGMGTHYCLGAALARVEGLVGLSKILGCWNDIEIDVVHARRNAFANLRGFVRLPLRVKNRCAHKTRQFASPWVQSQCRRSAGGA